MARLTRRVIDEALSDLGPDGIARVFEIARRRAEKVSRAAYSALVAEAPGDDDAALGGLPGVKSTVEVAMGAVMLPVEVEESISRIRQRYVQTDGVAAALLGETDSGESKGHTVVVELSADTTE